MIIRARTVVTADRPPIENGAIAVYGNQIVDAGSFDEIKASHAGEVIDLGEQALLPGLINAHCHLDYTCLRGKIPPQKSFSDWIRAINTEKAHLSPHDYIASINEGFAEAKRFGTTTIANLTAFPKLIPQIHTSIRTWWFAELIDVRAPDGANELVDCALEALDQTENWGLAPHALFTASENVYRLCEEIAHRENILLTTHLAESREEMQMFHDAAGPLYEFLRHIGRPMDDCGNKSPLSVFVRATGRRALPHWIVAHLNELNETDFEFLEKSALKFHIVHCPCSYDYFCHSQFPLERLRALGFNICLGTDSLASNDSLSLFDEMRAFQKRFPSVPPQETLRMVTVNPAGALRQKNELGRIRPGFKADLIAVPCSGSAEAFEQIIAFDGPVSWAMVNGECK
jgi:cytosine/adenosine deaminase-related metal-dependent hydrolase